METTSPTRPLMSATVSADYRIRVTCGAGGNWILVDDGRLLIVTLDNPAVPRVLVAEHGGFGDVGNTDPPIVTFAAADIDFFELFG